MTKNRKHKKSVRSVAAESGAKYTSTVRALDKPPAAAISGEPVSVAALHDSWLLPFGHELDGTPAAIHLGTDTTPPVTVIGGRVGSGKTVLMSHLVDAFCAQNPHGRVVELNAYPWPVRTSAQVVTCANLAEFEAAIAREGSDGSGPQGVVPTLVVVETEDLLPSHIHSEVRNREERRAQQVLTELARTGRSRNMRLVLTCLDISGAARSDQTLVNATRNLVYVGGSPVNNWDDFFEETRPAAVSKYNFVRAPLGTAWIAGPGEEPRQVVV